MAPDPAGPAMCRRSGRTHRIRSRLTLTCGYRIWPRAGRRRPSWGRSFCGKKVQLDDHVVVAACEGLIDPCPLQDRQFEGSFQEPPALPVVNKIYVAVGEPHRKRASGDVIRTQVPVELHVEVADRLVGVLAARSSLNGIDPRC